MAVNRDRLRRVFETMQPRQQAFVELVPLLFHVNHPLLPGYVSQDTPAGVSDYTPGRGAISAAKQLVRTFVYEQRMQRSYAIRGLYLMGSPGTIAYTRHSDLDVWLVHDPELAPEDVEKLREKARRIEDFSQGTGLEMHFFVFDAERFKRGQTLSLSDESSGSSQHYLLLDEFYRSGLLLAGLRPLWWAVPPDEEHRYDEFVEEALHKRILSARSYVDFGGLARIPAGEFFGGTIWQIYKSIESPYKSVMKLLLMEAYAAEYPKIGLLSHRHKLALLGDAVTLDELDPYIAMYRKLEEYLASQADKGRLRLLRRAFYIKANEALTQPPDPRQPAWRRENIAALTRQWGWDRSKLRELDRRAHWRIDTAIEERRELFVILRKSYSVLSDFGRRYANDKRITEKDLTILGRKIHAAFDKKPHKIELVTRGICGSPQEAALSLHQRHDGRGGSMWQLFDGEIAHAETARHPPLRQSSSLVEVLAWCYFNRLNGPATAWHHYVDGRRQSSLPIRKILDALEAAYPEHELAPADLSALARAPRVMRALFFVNIGTESALAGLSGGDVLTSDRNDAFQFGGQRANLVHGIDLLLHTSWEELFCYRYDGTEGMALAVCEYLNRLGASGDAVPQTALVHCFDGDYGHCIVTRITHYLAELGRSFARTPGGTDVHHVVSIGDGYCDVQRTPQGYRHRLYGSSGALYKALGLPPEKYRHVEFGGRLALDSPLAQVYAANRAGRLQIFALPRRDGIEVFLLAADGALCHYLHEDADPMPLFDHLSRFFANLGRHAELSEIERADRVECHLMKPAGSGYALQPVHPAGTDLRPYLPLRLFADLDRDRRPEFIAYLDDRQFSTREFGNGLFDAIAREVLALRETRARYPVYITDLELSPALLQARDIDPRNVIELLRQKLRIERQLTRALGDAPAAGDP
ncbi:MAG: class I adenylate cyclase [Gammaproteobacteria bacterium]